MDDRKQVLGMFSELDCLKAIMASTYNEGEIEVAKVRDIMTQNVQAQRPRDSIIDLEEPMFILKYKRRPVVLNTKLVGQVTCREILNIVTKNHWRRYIFWIF